MTDSSSIFRREALDFRDGVGQERAVLRVGGPWSRPMYWLVLVLAVAAIGVGCTVRADATTSGAALLDLPARTFTALMPVAAEPDLRPGQPVRLSLTGPAGRTLAAAVRTVQVIDDAGARRAGFASPAGPAVLVSGSLAADTDIAGSPSAGRQEGWAVVVLRSDRLINLFLDGVGGLFGKGGDA
jgi:hypothetical protein